MIRLALFSLDTFPPHGVKLHKGTWSNLLGKTAGRSPLGAGLLRNKAFPKANAVLK